MHNRLKSSLSAMLLLAGLAVSTPVLGASSISQEIINVAIDGCVSNPALIWATPGSASRLCPCFVANAVDAPLTDAQRIRLLSLISGQDTMRPYLKPLSADDKYEAVMALADVQKGCSQ